MRNKTLRAIFAGAAMALAPGAAPADNVVGTYLLDRVNDFADIFRIRVGLPDEGQAIGAKVRVTTLAQAGWLHFNGRYYGMDRRSIGGIEEWRTEGGFSVLYGSKTEMVPSFGNTFLREDSNWSNFADRRLVRYMVAWDDGRNRPDSIGAELALPVFAVDLGIYPFEIADFIFGFLTIDLYRDDRLRQPDAVELRVPTVPSRPDTTAPIAERQAYLERLEQLLVLDEEIAAYDQPMATNRARPDAPDAPSTVTTEDSESAVEASSEGLISPEDADALIDEVDATPAPQTNAPEADAERAAVRQSEAEEAARRAQERQADARQRQAERKAAEEAAAAAEADAP